jgi:hypothetical protein
MWLNAWYQSRFIWFVRFVTLAPIVIKHTSSARLESGRAAPRIDQRLSGRR